MNISSMLSTDAEQHDEKHNGDVNGNAHHDSIIKSLLPASRVDVQSEISPAYLNTFEFKVNKLHEIDSAMIKYNNLQALDSELHYLDAAKLHNFQAVDFINSNLNKVYVENKDVLASHKADRVLDLGSTRTHDLDKLNHLLKSNSAKAKALNSKLKPTPPNARTKAKRRNSVSEDDGKKRKKRLASSGASYNDFVEFEDDDESYDEKKTDVSDTSKDQKIIAKQYENVLISIWKDLSRKDGPKVSRLMQQASQSRLINLRKTSILAAREAKRWQLKNNKNQKDLSSKARRAMREMFNFWKRNERLERELRKKHEKEIMDKAKKEEEDREAKRQSRKLNFLITQTELYSHFIGKKIKTDEFEGKDSDPTIKFKSSNGESLEKYKNITGQSTDFNSIDFDNEDEEFLNEAAARNAQLALESAQTKARAFNNKGKVEEEPLENLDTNGEEMNFQNPTLMGDINITQPKLLRCILKEYQVKGLNWLANLYEQGINGILADEMGLGKTVQSISVLAYLAETHNIWGPFLVVTPASTLHNWQQEITKFLPDFKVLPYWGNAKDRKVLRKFWDRKNYRYYKDAPFHVLVTSYQLVVADAAYFQKMKWQYMILDEAQAIKSSQSSRWKSLLSFNCRNRLLLTGTPIQNSMQELWALLHFIMPSLFDSHDEFSDWFSKDIESHAQSNTQLNEQQLKRLHVILKPFMLRRIKKNVQSELGDKVEIDLFCDLTNRQKKYYQMLKSQISIMDLLESAKSSNDDSAQSLINLVMQFRKVCNHPDLFERADVKSSYSFSNFAETSSFLRESKDDLEYCYTTRNKIGFEIPRLIFDELLSPSYNSNVGSTNKIYSMFNIYDPANYDQEENGWLNLVDVSRSELHSLSKQSILERSIDHKTYTDINYQKINRLKLLYEDGFVPNSKKLLIAEFNNNHAYMTSSDILTELYNVKNSVYDEMYINSLYPAAEPIATAPPVIASCDSPSYQVRYQNELFDQKVRSSMMPLSLNTEYELLKKQVPVTEYPKSDLLPKPLNKLIDYSNIRMPSMNRFITESGKLAKLDELLFELKKNDHRVLIYFQMTRMMDLMEEYLTYRQHTYIRLDGSSKLDDRRDLVHDWQNKPEIFIFLLSTRAGGLGINLTAADTVVFYDSDWNPTIDSQAMDRAHRLGQTKQVTVYRLLTRNTIEERMRDRAKQKEQVQQVVMEGKSSLPMKKDENQNKKKDVAFLLLGGDDEGSLDQIPSSNTSNQVSKSNSKTNLEDMYHEGEGEFSTPS